MDIRSWSCSGEDVIRLGRPAFQDGVVCCERSWWRAAWDGLIRKSRTLECCTGVQAQRRRHRRRGSYDACSYALNFDEGRPWEEDQTDSLSRSFSMRFADPSRLKLLRQQVGLLDL